MSSPQPDADESDHWDGLSDHEDSDSSSSETAHAFLDVEASEAESDQQQSEDGSTDSEDEDDSPYFPQFIQLPAELRAMIWNAFCPDLNGEPRVFEIMVISSHSSASLIHRCPAQSASIRTVLAVHHESRGLALKTSPSQIVFQDEQALIPCNHLKDVVLLTFPPEGDPNDDALVLIDDSLSHFHNVALSMETVEYKSFFPSFLGLFTHLDNIFIVEEDMQQRSKGLAWCVSGRIHEYNVTVEQEWPDKPAETTYIWPDVTKYRDNAHREFPTHWLYTAMSDDSNSDDGLGPDWDERDFETKRLPDDVREPVAFDFMSRGWVYTIIRYRRLMSAHFGAQIDSPGAPEDDDEARSSRRLGVWPMATFLFESGHARLADLETRQQPWIDWDSSSDVSDRESSPNEYESDGIDDDDINDDHLSSDEEDDLPAHLLEDSDIEGSDIDGSDPMLIDISDLNGLQAAQFSSDSEADPDDDHSPNTSRSDAEDSSRGRTARSAKRRVIESNSEDEESSIETTGPTGTSRHRPHIIMESEDEDSEEEAAPREPPPRGVKRRARALLADSDDDDEAENGDKESLAPPRAVKRRARAAVSSESEEGHEKEGTKISKTQGGATAAGPTSNSNDNDDSSEDEEEEETSSNDEPAPPKRMSLAKRLQMEYGSSRAARPMGDSDDDDDDDEDDGEGHGYGGGVSDDDEGDEDGSDGECMVLGMGVTEEGEDEDDAEGMDGW